MELKSGGKNNVPFQPGAVILAAGESRRMGTPKAFLPLDGTTFLGEVLRAAEAASLAPIILVTNCDLQPRMEEAAPRARVLINPDPGRGQLSSLRIGIAGLMESKATGAVVFLLDHPGSLGNRVKILLRSAAQNAEKIHIAAWKGQPGHPMYLPRDAWHGLLEWDGPEGARGYLRSRPELVELVETEAPETIRDIDTPEEYRRMSGLP